MHRTAAAPHRQGELTLDAAEAANPEWAPWLRLLRRARAAMARGFVLDVGLAGARPADAPLLHGAVIAIDPAQLRDCLEDLRAVAEDGGGASLGPALREEESLALLGAAIALDAERLESLATEAGRDPAPFAVVMHLAAMPVLVACRNRLAGELPRGWTQGYCGVCGAWPAFAETRGLERERLARCGRCAAAWRFDVLRCPYCGEREHANLTSLLIEGDEMRRIDTCRTCGGYLKSLATLMAVPDDMVAVRDAETVELDLVAAERGLARPDRAGHPLAVDVVPRGAQRLSDGRRWVFA